MTCQRLYGGSVRHCECMLPNKGGWLECPPEARGADKRGMYLAQVPSIDALAVRHTAAFGRRMPPAGLFDTAKTVDVSASLSDAMQLGPPDEPLHLTPTGEMCQSCGAFAMIRTGTCLTCQVCHESSGGCS